MMRQARLGLAVVRRRYVGVSVRRSSPSVGDNDAERVGFGRGGQMTADRRLPLRAGGRRRLFCATYRPTNDALYRLVAVQSCAREAECLFALGYHWAKPRTNFAVWLSGMFPELGAFFWNYGKDLQIMQSALVVNAWGFMLIFASW